MTGKKIRVLVVDDSALMRKKISEIINNASDCEVIGTARDGYEALELLQKQKPDVITLDLELPNMDGLTCLVYIMCEWPTPVIVVSAFTSEGSEAALTALEYGAIDFVNKPGGVISTGMHTINEELLGKIRLASQVPAANLKICPVQKENHPKKKSQKPLQKIVLLGASTGGPKAVTQILQALPADFPAAILLIQHMPGHFITLFSQRLNEQCKLQVKQAESGDYVTPGKVLVAPGGYIMEVVKHGQADSPAQIQLRDDDRHTVSPSVDLSFASAARVFGPQVLGVILTGMGKDGTNGCVEIKQHGGETIAEDEASCIVFGMPASAIAAHAIDTVVPLDLIAETILKKVSRANG